MTNYDLLFLFGFCNNVISIRWHILLYFLQVRHEPYHIDREFRIFRTLFNFPRSHETILGKQNMAKQGSRRYWEHTQREWLLWKHPFLSIKAFTLLTKLISQATQISRLPKYNRVLVRSGGLWSSWEAARRSWETASTWSTPEVGSVVF